MSYPKARLGNYIDVLSGFAFKSKDFSETGVPVIKIKNISPPCVTLEDLSYVPQNIAFQNQRYILHKGDVLIAMTGSHINQIASVVGRVGRVRYDDVTVLNQRVSKIINKDDKTSDLDYIYYYLSQYDVKVELAQKAGGAANQANISPSDIKELLFPCPSIETQHRIATILSRYDALIENYQKQIKLLEEAAQRLYKEWFVDLRFPGYENTKVVDGVPEGWEKKKLGEITSKFATGLNPRKNFVLGNGNNYYVTIKNMANNDVIFDDKCDKVDDEALEKINKRSNLQSGDLLFSGIGTIGRVYLIDKPVKNWNISESVFTMRPKEGIPSTFLYLVLLDKEIQDYCQSNAHGCAQKGIRMADLKAFEILIPPKIILNAFNSFASNFIKQAKCKSYQIRLLTEARDRLLPKMMGGEINV